MKRSIRSKLREKRKNLSRSWVAEKSKVIEKFLLKELKGKKVVMAYASFDNEVNTYGIMSELIKMNRVVVLPKVVDKKIVEFFQDNSLPCKRNQN